ncbi:MAG: hypothetical protein KGS47_04995 [Chloroflexi bacterium]|nr:hypothetical protein [Chloroflexota bacterium]
MTDDQTADAIIARLHRCAISTREAAIDMTTFARTGADRHERQHAEAFIDAATRHADAVEARTHYAIVWLMAAQSTSVDEHAARLRQRIDEREHRRGA